MNVLILSKNLPSGLKFDQKEEWFNTKFTTLSISNELLSTWKNAKAYNDFHLPIKNEFIATNFDLLPIPAEIPEYPKSIADGVWYMQDTKFRLPIAFYYFYVTTPKISESAEKYVALALSKKIFTQWY